MQEILAQVLAYLRGIWRHRWIMILVAWVVCLIGWPWVFNLPDEYKANARVFVDTQSMLKPLLSGLTVDTNVEQQIGVMVRTLLSRPNLEKVARMTDLDLNAQTPEDMDDIIDDLRQNTLFKSRGFNMYDLGYTDDDPQLAKRIVQSLLTLFVESTLGASRLDTDSAQRFLDEQIKEYEARLDAADERLRAFKRKHMGMMPGKEGDYYSRMQGSLATIKQLALELRELDQRKEELQKALASENPLVISSEGMPMDGPPTPYDARIHQTEAELEGLLARYTPRHPDVIFSKRSLRNLRQQRQEFLTDAEGPQAEGASNNPVYQQIKIALSETEAKIAALKARAEEYQQRVRHEEQMVDTILQVEIDSKRLNRNYSLNKSRYSSLLQRRDLARMSQDVEERADDVKFKVIEPPRVGNQPVGPNRPRLLSIAMVVGLVLGLGAAFFLSLVRSFFDTRKMLMDTTELPVLGSVSMVWTSAQIFKRRLERIAFFLVSIALVGAYAAVMAIQLFKGG